MALACQRLSRWITLADRALLARGHLGLQPEVVGRGHRPAAPPGAPRRPGKAGWKQVRGRAGGSPLLEAQADAELHQAVLALRRIAAGEDAGLAESPGGDDAVVLRRVLGVEQVEDLGDAFDRHRLVDRDLLGQAQVELLEGAGAAGVE